MKSTLENHLMGHFKDFKRSLCTKSRLFEGPETFLVSKRLGSKRPVFKFDILIKQKV
jgi:hypothetical protein